MMGLGSRRLINDLLHPKNAGPGSTADSDIVDFALLGAIVVFAGGSLLWFLGDRNPPLFFEYYEFRSEYLQFFFGLVFQMVLVMLCAWATDLSQIGARAAMIFVTVIFVALASVWLVASLPNLLHAAAFSLLLLYSVVIDVVVVKQLIVLITRKRENP